MKTRGILARVVVVLVLLGCFAPSAGAFLRDFQVSEFSSADNNSLKKALRFDCPRAQSEPQAALGAGAGALGTRGGGELGIQGAVAGIKPNPAAFVPPGSPFNSMDITAAANDPNKETWTLKAQTFCATNTPVAPTASDAARYLKEVRVVRAKGSTDSARNGFKGVDVNCTTISAPGRPLTPIGGGFTLDAGTFKSNAPKQVTAHFLTRTATGFRATAGEADPTNSNWRIQSYVICANLGAPIDPASGFQSQFVQSIRTVSGSSTTGASRSSRSAFAVCPAGHFVIGGGAEVKRQGRNPSTPVTNNVALSASQPAVLGPNGAMVDSSAFDGNAWFAAAREVDDTNSDWNLQVRATCATFGPVAI